jgi:thioredoxin 1
VNQKLPSSFFDLIATSDKPVLVDFHAEWCGPCKMVSPVIQRIAKEKKGEILTVKIDVDKKQNIAARYEVQSVPTIVLFKNGEPAMRLAGAHPYDVLISEIEKHL